MPRLDKQTKAEAQRLGIRTTQNQKGLFNDKPRSKGKPKVYNSEYIDKYRADRNIILMEKYTYLQNFIEPDGTLNHDKYLQWKLNNE